MTHTATAYLEQLQSLRYKYNSDGLFGGRLGLVWLHYYEWVATRQASYKDRCLALIGEVFEHLNQEAPQLYGASLSAGAAGFGYVVAQLHREG